MFGKSTRAGRVVLLIILMMSALTVVLAAVSFLPGLLASGGGDSQTDTHASSGTLTETGAQTGGTATGDTQEEDSRERQERISQLEEILALPELRLVNRDNPLPSDYAPDDLVSIGGVKLASAAAEAMDALLEAASADGVDTLVIYSGYRDYDLQSRLYEKQVSSVMASLGVSRDKAEAIAAASVAVPGTSEHQYGYSADVCTAEIVNTYGDLNEAFADTDEGIWLKENCYKFGFIIRYPKDKQDVTHITFEPWHLRYVGVEAAQAMHESGLCLEEYIDSLKEELAQLKADEAAASAG